jgi:hypothetical protein
VNKFYNIPNTVIIMIYEDYFRLPFRHTTVTNLLIDWMCEIKRIYPSRPGRFGFWLCR